ncbi:hypothetical protein [Microbacterium sp. RU33B]|uniref:hypothetical protein n=1 Tax=Microbacterium sp. RU33B TaxID=1907390 RepID=UPI0009647AA1|nr:hypothetical protein [Microbacterium sp. RU33B]SIT69936.1 alternate signal-mediated exported protein, RER_14450 family [Microbacterium sp. RU33B]
MSAAVAPIRPRRGRRWGVALAAVFLIAVPAGVAYAFWNDAAAQAGGVVVTGDLRLESDPSAASAVSWVETTPTVPVGDRRSGADIASLAEFRGVPGDSVDVRYAVATTLAGDNIAAVLTADLGAPAPVLPAGLTITGYRVLDAAGSLLAPTSGFAALGEEISLPSLTSAGDQRYLVALRLEWTGTTGALVYTSTLTGPDPATLITIPVAIRLDQVRAGAGFQP